MKPIIAYAPPSSLFSTHLVDSRLLYSAHLVAGTPQSVVSSHCILAVVSPDDDDDVQDGPNVFQKLGVLRKVAQKAQESAGNEKPSIARPAREAREALKALGDDA